MLLNQSNGLKIRSVNTLRSNMLRCGVILTPLLSTSDLPFGAEVNLAGLISPRHVLGASVADLPAMAARR